MMVDAAAGRGAACWTGVSFESCKWLLRAAIHKAWWEAAAAAVAARPGIMAPTIGRRTGRQVYILVAAGNGSC